MVTDPAARILQLQKNRQTASLSLFHAAMVPFQLHFWVITRCSLGLTTPARLGAALRRVQYDASTVADRVVGRAVLAPTALLKKSSSRPKLTDALDVLICLFCLGLKVPLTEAERHLDSDLLDLLWSAELLSGDDEISGTRALSPIGDLVIMTDFPPPAQEEPVMYLGPDSAALFDVVARLNLKGARVLDLCAGSGVQGLAALYSGAASCHAVDKQQRASDFTLFNFHLNFGSGETKRRRKRQHYRRRSQKKKKMMATYDVILANPPFVAVPESVKYEVFADGGPTGEAVVEDVIRIARRALAPDGLLAVVLEVNGDPTDLGTRISHWWHDQEEESSGLRCVVVVETPTPSAESANVAKRRGSQSWLTNLEAQGIETVRKGFIFARRTTTTSEETRVLTTPRLWAAPGLNPEARAVVAEALYFLRSHHL